MRIENIYIAATIVKAMTLIHKYNESSAAMKSMFEVLILIITHLDNRLNIDNSNGSRPPSNDPNRKKQQKSKSLNNTAG